MKPQKLASSPSLVSPHKCLLCSGLHCSSTSTGAQCSHAKHLHVCLAGNSPACGFDPCGWDGSGRQVCQTRAPKVLLCSENWELENNYHFYLWYLPDGSLDLWLIFMCPSHRSPFPPLLHSQKKTRYFSVCLALPEACPVASVWECESHHIIRVMNQFSNPLISISAWQLIALLGQVM